MPYHVTEYRLHCPKSRAWDKHSHASCLSRGATSRGRSWKQAERKKEQEKANIRMYYWVGPCYIRLGVGSGGIMCDAHVIHQGGRDKVLLHQLLLPIGLALSHPHAWEPSNSWRASTLQQRKRRTMRSITLAWELCPWHCWKSLPTWSPQEWLE